MRPDTKELKYKYLYFFNLLDYNRHDLFNALTFDEITDIYTDLLDVDKFTSYIFHVNYTYILMIRNWYYFLSYRSSIVKKFEQRKNILKRKAYKTILGSYFCPDIVNEIIEFI